MIFIFNIIFFNNNIKTPLSPYYLDYYFSIDNSNFIYYLHFGKIANTIYFMTNLIDGSGYGHPLLLL